MNILSIGNSFSQDAQRYLHQIAKADGLKIEPCIQNAEAEFEYLGKKYIMLL